MTAIIQTFWRKPKPSCNWCPRITFAYIVRDEYEARKHIPDGHNMSSQSLLIWLNAEYVINGPHVTSVRIMPEIEVTIQQFSTWKH